MTSCHRLYRGDACLCGLCYCWADAETIPCYTYGWVGVRLCLVGVVGVRDGVAPPILVSFCCHFVSFLGVFNFPLREASIPQ